MNMKNKQSEAIPAFTSQNEHYLGRESVYHFNQVIISCLEANNVHDFEMKWEVD